MRHALREVVAHRLVIRPYLEQSSIAAEAEDPQAGMGGAWPTAWALGPRPLRLADGWLVLHNGVAGHRQPGPVDHQLRSATRPGPCSSTRRRHLRLAKSASPLLEPE